MKTPLRRGFLCGVRVFRRIFVSISPKRVDYFAVADKNIAK